MLQSANRCLQCWVLFGFCLAWCTFETTARAEPAVRAGLEFIRLSRSPVTRIKKGGMIALQASVRNSGKVPAVGQLVGRLAGQSGEEDRRQIELAPGEEKSFDLHIRVSAKTTTSPISVIVTLNAIENGREIMLKKGDEPVSETLTLQFDEELVSTAIALTEEPLEGAYWRWPETEPYASYELVLASRVDLGLTRRCILMDGEPITLNSVDWKSVETLVVGKPETLMDSAVVATLQAFLQRGGKVMVLLDEIDTSLIRSLMVHDQQCETIETVELNHIVMDVNSPTVLSLKDRTIDSDKPMKLKRVLQHGGRVTHSIDGWPAAITMKIGSGELLITTLECKAWLKPRFLQSNDQMSRSNFSVPLWEGTVSSSLNSAKLLDPFEAFDASYPIQLIGSPVVSRQLVGSILIGFCILLVAAGIGATVAGDLRRIGYIAPGVAIVSTIPLVLAASWTRSDIPEMVSELQFAQFWPSGGGLIRSKAAVYLSASRSMDLVSKENGYAVPSENVESGVRSIITKDFESWQLSNTDWPPGTWRTKSEVALSQGSFSAKSQLTDKGLELELPEGLPSAPEDIVVCFTPGSLSLGNWTETNKSILVDGELPADGNRWTSASIVSDEQGRRATVYNNVFQPSETRRSPAPRTLYFWTGLWPQAPVWNAKLERRGAALVSVPIELAVPAVGTRVFIPYPLIKIEPQDQNLAVSTIFNYRTGHWAEEASLETEADLSFVLPHEAVPLEATSINIDWDIEAPKRKVRLIWSAKDSPIDIVELDSPSIPWRGSIDNPRVLKDLMDGRLDLRIAITNGDGIDSQSQNNFISWRIKHLRMSITGQTLPRNNLAKTSGK